MTELFKEITDVNYTYIYLTMLILMYYITNFIAVNIKLAISETKKELGTHDSIPTWTAIFWAFKSMSMLASASFVALLSFYLLKFYKLI